MLIMLKNKSFSSFQHQTVCIDVKNSKIEQLVVRKRNYKQYCNSFFISGHQSLGAHTDITVSRSWWIRCWPNFNFFRLCHYFVVITEKYNGDLLQRASYKRLKSFQFFYEGHIKTMKLYTTELFMFILK